MTNRIKDADEQVLSTLNKDGTRKLIRPKLSSGRFLSARRGVGWTLIIIFTCLPYLQIRGKPAILLDIPAREFTFFGLTFLPTDTMLLMLLLVGIFVSIFLVTAILGRVWCGWACPQTVYMELVYRPIERFFEGSPTQQRKIDREGMTPRRALKYFIFLVISMFLAHTFLAYFVGVRTLARWVQQSPFEHPGAFFVMAFVTALMVFDFTYFREQMCILACPYGRFQSVLLDRQSLVVGYDRGRGEPRGRMRERRNRPEESFGDCIECEACVATCPTGIDIRDGLQMECIGCTQCIDACDAIMDRIGKRRGLIRYSSQDALESGRSRIIRPRVLLYPLILIVVFGGLAFSLAKKESTDITVLRGLSAPFSTLPSGEISNQLRIKIVNRENSERSFFISIENLPDSRIIAPQNPLVVPAGRQVTTTIFVIALPRVFEENGSHEIIVRVSDGRGYVRDMPYRVLGPQSRKHHPAKMESEQ